MAKFAVYRQRRDMITMSPGEVVRNADTPEDVRMTTLVLRPDQPDPVLLGLDGHPSIVKRYEEGDEELTFEQLYDRALTLADYHRMREHRVSRKADLPPGTYRVEVELAIPRTFDFVVYVKADAAGHVPRRIFELLHQTPSSALDATGQESEAEDSSFLVTITRAVANELMGHLPEFHYAVRDTHNVAAELALPQDQDWKLGD